jgi:competence protein ComEC
MAHRLDHAPPLLGDARAGGFRFGRLGAVAKTLALERERWVLWLPVAVGLGVTLYFALPTEPALWVVPLSLPLVCLLYGRLGQHRLRPGKPALAAGLTLWLALLLLGFGVAQVRTFQVEAPVLERRGALWLEGEILLVEPRVKGERLLLGEVAIDDLAAEATPRRVRFTRRSADPPL